MDTDRSSDQQPPIQQQQHQSQNQHQPAQQQQQHQPQQQQQQQGRSRSGRSALLHKQREIEEVDEEDTSPGSDQSDTTITAGSENAPARETDSPSPSDDLNLKPPPPVAANKHNHISPKLKQLTRSEAVFDDAASPPLDPLQSTVDTCSTDSSSSGIGTNTVTSGSGSSYHGRLEKDGSQSSEAGTSSSLSRDSSVDTPYKDSTGIDLEDFIRKTLNKTPKDRSMLIKLEVDLIKFIREPEHHYLKFPPMSSYDRMLVHRIAAFFGLDHNVDQTGKCVIVNKTQNTRIPDFSFQDNIAANGNELKPKMVLKRGGGSFDESQTRNLQKPSLDATRSARSLEERQQLYNEARSRIFTGDEQMEGHPTGYSQEEASVTGIVQKLGCPPSFGDHENPAWSSMESSGYGTDSSCKPRIYMPMPKANSFGGTGSFMLNHLKSSMRAVSLSKADSLSIGGPSAGCMGNSVMRPLVMSSPTYPGGGGQSDSSSPVTQAPAGGPQGKSFMLGFGTSEAPDQMAGSMPIPGQKVYWVASDVNNIPAGSVVINPQTGQPYVNQDGSTYKYTPGQPLPQPGPGYASPLPQIGTVPQPVDWANQRSQDSQPELCHQLSVMGLPSQSSMDSDSSTSAAAIPQASTQQPVIINPSMHQQPTTPTFQPQAMANQPQTGYYPGGPTIPGAQQVRYMCIPNGTGGAGATAQGYVPTPGGLIMDGQQGQVYPAQQLYQPYLPSYPVNSMYPVNSSQGQMQGQIAGQGQGPSSEGTAAYQYSGYSIGSPVDGPTAYSYPVQYNQTFTAAPNQSQMYYALPTPQTNQPQGYTYTGQQGTTYQSNTPPSQNSTNPNVQLNSVAGAVPATAASGSAPNLNVNLNNMNNAGGMNSNIPQQGPHPPTGMVVSQGAQGAQPQMAPSATFMYNSSPHASHTAPQCPPTFRMAAPASAVTAASQHVPLQGGPMMGQAPPPHVPYHQNTVYRQNMQHLPMQIHSSSQQQQQTPQPSTGVATKANHQPSQHSHVTVSAKSVSYEQAGTQQPSGTGAKVENGTGENGDVTTPARSMSEGPTTGAYRPPLQTNPADGMRVQYPAQSSQYRPAAQVQQQFPQPQSVGKSPTLVPKPQRVKKTRSRDGHAGRNSSTNAPSASSGPMVTSRNVLEVCDLPRKLGQHELDGLLRELLLAGARLQYLSGEPASHNGVESSTTSAAAATTNHTQAISQAVTPARRVFAIFRDAETANQILQTHSSSTYKLRLSDTSSASTGQLHASAV